MNILNNFKLTGKAAIVTGASSGLGISFSEALAEAGADVMICARRVDKLKVNAKQISKATGRTIVPFKCDVANEEDIHATVKAAEKEFGKIDILVNNAGVAVMTDTIHLTKKHWNDTLSVDVTGVFFMAREVIKSMIAHKIEGSIINLASIYGLGGDIIAVPSYYASKGAVVNLTRALAAEFAQKKIRVNAIAPGFFPSEMTQTALSDKGFLSHVVSKTPMGRVGDPKELKGAAVYLASEASSYVTGVILPVDGGWSCV